MKNHVVDVSVVIPVSERHDDIKKIYAMHAVELKTLGKSHEFIFVVDGFFPHACSAIQELIDTGEPVKIIKFARPFGEAACLSEGFRRAGGESVLTIASYIQVDPAGIRRLFEEQKKGHGLVITRRFPRKDPLINRIQSNVFHYMVKKLSNTPFNDITSGMRLIKSDLLPEFTLYGDLHRFIPVFADQKGIKVKEVPVPQRDEDTENRVVKPGIYLRRILDILTLFFLIKFTKKPLRFFGIIGSSLFLSGSCITFYLGLLRLTGQIGLSNKPSLLAGLLLIVFGIQTFSVGLIGELIIYSHAKEIDDYKIEQIIE